MGKIRKLKRTNFPELFPIGKRTEGKHISVAIHKIMVSIYPERFDRDTPISLGRANFGNAVERMIIEGLKEIDPNRYARPREVELEDWYGTPDLLDTVDHAVVEVKLTWASMRRADDIEGEWFWRYWVQGAAYAYMLGLKKVRLYVCFINGNYSRDDNDPDAGPQIEGWERTYTDDELEENWNMLKAQC